jgi:RimJ/RimL family protein N-acetyltransferase
MFKLVKNQRQYWEFIRTLRNDERVQDGFIDKLPQISSQQQTEYMDKYENQFYVCLNDMNIPMGYIRHMDGDIGVCTSPEYWGKGIGTFMIKELMKLHPECYAKIKLDNEASIRAFEKAGFKKKYYILEME